jgi:hypothetical protein
MYGTAVDGGAQAPSVVTRRRSLVLGAMGVALLWVPLALLHPIPTDMLEGDTTTWLIVHWAQLVLAPILGLVLLAMLGGLSGAAALVARVGVVVWVGLFSATDAVAGIATGILVEGGFAVAARYLWDHVLVSGGAGVIGVISHWAVWPTAAVAAGLALRRHGAPKRVYVPMFMAVLLMFPGHGNEISAIGAVALTVAVYGALTTPLVRLTAPGGPPARPRPPGRQQ